MCILHTTLLLTKRAIAAKILKYIKDKKTLLKKSHDYSNPYSLIKSIHLRHKPFIVAM